MLLINKSIECILIGNLINKHGKYTQLSWSQFLSTDTLCNSFNLEINYPVVLVLFIFLSFSIICLWACFMLLIVLCIWLLQYLLHHLLYHWGCWNDLLLKKGGWGCTYRKTNPLQTLLFWFTERVSGSMIVPTTLRTEELRFSLNFCGLRHVKKTLAEGDVDNLQELFLGKEGRNVQIILCNLIVNPLNK